jgi:hypothetical protein
MVFLFPAGMLLNKSLVSDIPAGTGKPLNFFYSVHAPKGLNAYIPILELPLVVVELDAARVLHAAHDVDHILLFHHHDGGVVSPFFPAIDQSCYLTTSFSLIALIARMLVLQLAINQASYCPPHLPLLHPSWKLRGHAQGCVRKGTEKREERHIKVREQAQGSAGQAQDRERTGYMELRGQVQ